VYKLSLNKVRKWKTDERQLRAHAVGAPTVATARADNASSEPGKLTAAFDGSMEIASYTYWVTVTYFRCSISMLYGFSRHLVGKSLINVPCCDIT